MSHLCKNIQNETSVEAEILEKKIMHVERELDGLCIPGIYVPPQKDYLKKSHWDKVPYFFTGVLTLAVLGGSCFALRDLWHHIGFAGHLWQKICITGVCVLAEAGAGAICLFQMRQRKRRRMEAAQKLWEETNEKLYEIFKIRDNERIRNEWYKKEALESELHRLREAQQRLLEKQGDVCDGEQQDFTA